MPSKTRIITVSLLILLGAILFCYCAAFYPPDNTTQAEGVSTTVTESGVTSAQATSICNAEQGKSDRLGQTCSPSKPRPRTAPT